MVVLYLHSSSHLFQVGPAHIVESLVQFKLLSCLCTGVSVALLDTCSTCSRVLCNKTVSTKQVSGRYTFVCEG